MPTFPGKRVQHRRRWRVGSRRKPDTKVQSPDLLPLGTVSFLTFPVSSLYFCTLLFHFVASRDPCLSSPRFSCPPNLTVTGGADQFSPHPPAPLPPSLHLPSPGSLGPRQPFLQEDEAGFLGNDRWGTGEGEKAGIPAGEGSDEAYAIPAAL